MERLYKSPDMNVQKHLQKLMREFALHFSEFTISNENNLYVHFIKKLKPVAGQTIFSTLNYDLLFEDASESLGYRINCFQESKVDLTYLKLHGSCNFIPDPTLNNTFTNCFVIGESGGFNFPIAACTREEVRKFCSTDGNIYPTMALYANTKPTQFGSQAIEDIRYRWKHHVQSADKILIIGVRPYPLDTHIWKPLENSTATIGYIGSTEFNQWHNSFRINKDDYFIGTKWIDHLEESVGFLTES